MNLYWIGYLIVFFGVLNLLRMSAFLIGSDLYGLKQAIKNKKKRSRPYLPLFSIVIPAHNEEKTIVRAVASLVENNYPKDKLEIIVVDDGSTDKTAKLVALYKKRNKIKYLKLLRQKNAGKARALNRAIKKYAHGDLVMCLDADSYLEREALAKAASYFRDQKVMAVSSNVKIVDRGTLLNLIQKFEYMICYQMKRAQTIFNVEYIIGGIGSTFRKKALEKVGYYDTNTVTEDIDLTMKILRGGNKRNRVIYGADVVAWTEAVPNISGLIRQRYRWKYGRSQTFFKNSDMFFNAQKKFTKGLTWFYLPYAVFCDFAFFFEPLMVGYILVISIFYQNFLTILGAFLVISSYIILNIVAEDTFNNRDKLKLILIAPTMYFYFYILSFVEYIALIRALFNLRIIKQSIESDICHWKHVDRPATTAVLKSI